jgi:predicted AlkP superfamily pyrophosphatase or phosphodiesterase
MKKIFFLLLCLPELTLAQNKTGPPEIAAPKLIVGIVVDQMRFDYLYKYKAKFGKDGFLRLMNEGFNCRNTTYNYVPTYTGPGHASIYSGTTPAVHGIIANSWYDRNKKQVMYCSSDKSVNTVGAKGNAGQMSPRNMLTSTITDEVHLANHLHSKVIGLALKDRGAILPAGHTANAAYWYDASGSWISSTYYMKELPTWVQDFNKKEKAKEYLSKPWNTLLPVSTYNESIPDDNPYETLFKGEKSPVFPHDLPSLMAANGGLDLIRTTPFGNSLTKDFAIETIKGENLGKENGTDFLTISFSSTDYVGHSFGPQSVEVEDTYLRLDKDLAELLKFLDTWVGKEHVLVFLTADHAVVDVPQFLTDQKIPAGTFESKPVLDSLKKYLRQKYNDTSLVLGYANQQIYLDHEIMNKLNLSEAAFEEDIASFLLRFKGIATTVTACALRNSGFAEDDTRSFIQKGYLPSRSGDVMINFEPAWIEAEKVSTTHGSPYSYDTHVPLIWYGWAIPPGSSIDAVHPTDIAPTISLLLNIPFPDGCTGKVIPAILNSGR